MKPGTRLLKIAPSLFNERFIASVVRPTIADLQSEVDAAGPHRGRRLRALCRGYAAFWGLVFAAPFATWSDDRAEISNARLAAGAAIVGLLMAVVFGGWTVIVAAAGTLVAFLIHAWHERHPSEIAVPTEHHWRSPQINFSSTEVGANAGGLIFVVGSVMIVSLGLPSVLWFLLTAAIAAGFVAWGLAVWHRRTRGDGLTSAVRGPRQLL
jgi:hypothetical protein